MWKHKLPGRLKLPGEVVLTRSRNRGLRYPASPGGLIKENMTETTTEAPVKKELTSEQIISRNVRKMSNKQMGRRLNRLARQKTSMIDGLWSDVLTTVFQNTESSGLGGKLAPFLR